MKICFITYFADIKRNRQLLTIILAFVGKKLNLPLLSYFAFFNTLLIKWSFNPQPE